MIETVELKEDEVILNGWVWAIAVRGKCRACKGTGIRDGVQWGSSEWPGCDTCAPHMLVIGHVVEGDPMMASHQFIGKEIFLAPIREAS